MLTLKQDTMLGDVPDDWAVKPLKKLLEFNAPGDWGDDGGPHMFRVLRSTNLTNERRLDRSSIALRALKPERVEKLAPRKGDILLERSGGGPAQPVGRVGHVADDLPGHAFSNFLHLLRPDATEINPAFLSWVLFRINRTGRILRLEQQTTQLRNLNFRDYLTMPLPVPPPDEQAAIARVLDAVDTAIDTAREALCKAELFDHSLLHDLLERGNTKRAHWQHKRVSEVAEVGSGVTLGKDVTGFKHVELPYLRVANVQDGHFNLSTIKTVKIRVDEVERYRLEVGDVLMTEGGDLDKLGRGTLWEGQIPDCLHQNHIFRVRADRSQLDPRFFSLVIESDIAKRYFNRVAKRTTNLASTNKTQVRAFSFPLPPLKEQEQIADVMGASKARLRALKSKCAGLEQLRKSLMHDLLTGSVRIDPALFKQEASA
ncbi:hypothetical protein MAFF211491_00180 [Ralstonia solanacearum]|nr:hypothetical protein MAFF211491_00180 [Ralstonia solanacearum]BCM10828.1 hypothetical protein MAFF241648_00180 [Ralstonia solanacearum]